MLTHIFGAIVEAKIHAWFADLGMLAAAIGFAVAGIAILSLPVPTIERLPLLGRLITGARHTFAYVALGIAIGLACLFIGSRSGGALEREVCRAKIEAIADANRKAIDDAREAERTRTAEQVRAANEAVDRLSAEKASADADATELRRRIADMEAADPKQARAQAPAIILRAIKGARAK